LAAIAQISFKSEINKTKFNLNDAHARATVQTIDLHWCATDCPHALKGV
jgi:hypothetical protein